MIPKAERIYYIDPIQNPAPRRLTANGTELTLEVVALKYRRDNFKQDRLGTIVPVTHQRVDAQELWWVDADGDYVQGAQVADRIIGRGDALSFINDDVFILGRFGGEHNFGNGRYGSLLVNTMRSDGKRLVGQPHANFTFMSDRVFKAAPWARELMPVVGDTQDVVDAKVLRAKQLFTQRQRKGSIYKEGMRRDWLHHLADLRTDHDMPIPRFVVGVDGVYMPSSAETVAVDDLTPAQRDRVAGVRARTVIRSDGTPRAGEPDTFPQYIGVPFATVTTSSVSNVEEMHRITSNDIRYGVFDALRVSSGHVMENYRFAVLSDF